MGLNHSLTRETVETIAGMATERFKGDQAKSVAAFTRSFYAHVPPTDILGEDKENLFGAAVSMWSFAQERRPGTPKIQVYNPEFEAHGWQTSHTVVAILNDDMPFLVDSVTQELNAQGLTVHLVIHPIVGVQRTDKGKLKAIGDRDADGFTPESVMHIEISEQSDPKRLKRIEDRLTSVLADVRAAVEDWRRMRAAMLDTIAEIEKNPPKRPKEEIEEDKEFLRWVEDNHFTFLGCRDYSFTGRGAKLARKPVPGTGLGILRDDARPVFDNLRDLGALPERVRDFLLAPTLVTVLKANAKSTVHRGVEMDTIAIKTFDAKGNVVGERRFVGLFTSVAYNQSPKEIPLLRGKVRRTVESSGFPPSSHDGKALVNILETFPRDELFQIAEEELFHIALGILHLQERQRVALFTRTDAFERFVSCFVYVPTEAYNTTLRKRIEAILRNAFEGTDVSFTAQIGESVLARLHVIIRTRRGAIPAVDIRDLEQQLAEEAKTWSDRLRAALIEAKGEEKGLALHREYGAAFQTAYMEGFGARAAVRDIEQIEAIRHRGTLSLNLYRPMGAQPDELRFKLFHIGEPVPLSDVLPMLENMGLKVVSEVPYQIAPRSLQEGDGAEEAGIIYVHDFFMRTLNGLEVDASAIRATFENAFEAVWNGESENDGFNALVLGAGVDWRAASVFRAYAKYLRQTGFTFSQDYMEETLAAFPTMSQALADLFRVRFDPRTEHRDKAAEALLADIEAGLDAVDNLDQDRILRAFLNLIQSTLRTNFYQKLRGGGHKGYISMKLDSRAILDLPAPRPMVEIWVYSPRVEGVHLRGGKVARGGLRWSDRREDFRSEILDLMKAQMVKNAVIVPVGSKGGFVVKRPPTGGGREAMQEEGIACYKTFISGLLDLTDNVHDGGIKPPSQVVRHDPDDPYLVVAADKGTATFSDIANGVSAEYGFWLGDAFASGGSAGYDHKKMGITARGAWESVKRHFAEMDHDTQSQDFTVVGVGDMGGDVFGNGMLLSPHIRLIAAFNHMHIFIDPNPDAAASFEERKRLFEMPRSTWMDYDPAKLSKGGAIYERKQKTIRVTPEIRKVLDLTKDEVRPDELMRAILLARADLIWFGGIGTYVKAADESHQDAKDRANDAIRVNGRELRVKVVGEGANLGVTQAGRIEFAARGGRVNTDFIDNSAGVDCSDHEVNIKILLGSVVASGDMTEKQRNALLEDMTEEVAELVLRDNYLQTLAMSVEEAQAADLLGAHAHLIRSLERNANLDRAIQGLPDEEEIQRRQSLNLGLARPELAVLLSYSKMWLYEELLASDLPDESLLESDLERYFPKALRKDFAKQIRGHRLRREIIATFITNSMVNRVGSTFVDQMADKTSRSAADIARAYSVTRDAFDLRSLWGDIEALDRKVPSALQHRMIAEGVRLVERATLWFLGYSAESLDITKTVDLFLPALAELAGSLESLLPAGDLAALKRQAGELQKKGVPEALALRVSSLRQIGSGLDIVRIASEDEDHSVSDVALVYFTTGDLLGHNWLRQAAGGLPTDTYWRKQALNAIVDELYAHQTRVTRAVLQEDGDCQAAIRAWMGANQAGVERTTQLLADLKAAPAVDLAMLAVANRQMRALTPDR